MISRRALLGGGLGAAAVLAIPKGVARALAAKTETPGVYARSIVIDTLSPDGPYFDPKKAVEAGLTAAVIDLSLFPRNFPGAVDALAEWSSVFHRSGSGFLKVLK